MIARYLVRAALALLDAGGLLLSFWLAWHTRFELVPLLFPRMTHVPQPLSGMTGFLLLCAGAQLFFALSSGLYRFGMDDLRRQVFGSLRVVVLLFIVAVSYLVVFKLNFQFSRLATLIAMGYLALLMPLGRALAFRLVMRSRLLQVPCLVIGRGEPLKDFLATAEHSDFAQQNRILDSLTPEDLLDGDGQRLRDEAERRITDLMTGQGLDKVVILMEGISRQHLVSLLRAFEIRLKYIRMVPDASSLALVGTRMLTLHSHALLGLEQRLTRPWNRAVKRVCDTMLVLPLLPAALLVIVLAAPALAFRPLQRIRRWDLAGRPVDLWQLRVRYEDGGFLFQSGLYKLPELLGVLAGHQALVGPAPLIEREVEAYRRFGPGMATLRPGLTGLWQVSNFGYFDQDHRVALDMYYLMNWSLWMDLRILMESAYKGLYSLFHPRQGAMRT